ncbi:hypothetical protein [Dyella caseinilytica]|uniref:Uncharacterized protein n=1 Tax=Dyella caseinilytica TaxID=1849581 RepID=A0ABX7GWQ6_9GAMM|nr:hypothetical protein [Dyella caseinilytica]QRN54842.1 hypothetical protein ISN74_05665 [Dyella caseinilytica]GFZ97299.1 hypothetical protein GCM10011408_17210 [Dyella caseinilytica]
MRNQKSNAFRFAGLFAVALAIGLVAGSAWADVYIYRGLSADSKGNAKLNPGTFKFNDDLSTFDQPIAGAKCNYRFTVTNLPDPIEKEDEGDVEGLAGYRASFDDDPKGHWSIKAPEGVSTEDAAKAVAEYAKANKGNIVNGTQDNCK